MWHTTKEGLIPSIEKKVLLINSSFYFYFTKDLKNPRDKNCVIY